MTLTTWRRGREFRRDGDQRLRCPTILPECLWPVAQYSASSHLMTDQLETARRSYAEELHFTAHLRSPAVVAAFATVPRERFVGAGPWRVRSPTDMAEYWTTDDADPRAIYHDVLIALDEARGINNGQSFISAAAPATTPRSWPNLSGLWERSRRSRSIQALPKRRGRHSYPGRRSRSETRTEQASPSNRLTLSLRAPAQPTRYRHGSTRSIRVDDSCFQ
jgi:hypothetical protein